MPEPEARTGARGRLVFAALLFAGLGIGVAVVIFSGGDSEDPDAADPACIEEWNSDPAALSLGTHQASGHGYTAVEVTRLSGDGEEPAEGEEGACAVVFAARFLDPELSAAAQIRKEGRWAALSESEQVSEGRLSELQSAATADANATVTPDGRLADLYGEPPDPASLPDNPTETTSIGAEGPP